MSAAPPASEAQIRYLVGLTQPERLAELSSAEARTLIAWLRGPPANMTRAQQAYLSSLIDRLTRPQVRELIERLRGLVEPAAPAGAESEAERIERGLPWMKREARQ